MQQIPQNIQPPNIVDGFRSNVVSPLPRVTQPVPQLPQQLPPQVQLPSPDIQADLCQMVPILDPVLIDNFSIFGQEFQKKYVYIALVLILGIVAYFLWKWWYGPKKGKKGGKFISEEVDEYTEEEEEEEEEEDEEVFIPQYQSKNSESKGNKKKEDE